MECQRCKSKRLAAICGKVSDLCSFGSLEHSQEQGYVPFCGLGDDGDYIEFSYCLACGQIKGTFPLLKVKPAYG